MMGPGIIVVLLIALVVVGVVWIIMSAIQRLKIRKQIQQADSYNKLE